MSEDTYDQNQRTGEQQAARGYALTGSDGPYIPDDYSIRQSVLYQACHDLKGTTDEREVLGRARSYFDFVKNG